MKGTKLVIEATTPLVFSEGAQAERDGYVAFVTGLVSAHGAADVTVTLGEEVDFLSPWGAEATTES